MRLTPATAAITLVLLVGACEGNGELRPPARPTLSPRSQLQIGDPQSFIPATYKQRSKLVMPVTFPDGSTADIVYPKGLDIAAMGAQPYSSGSLGNCCGRDFFVLYGAVPQSQLAGDNPLEIYPGADGSPVEYWAVGADAHDPETDRWLIFNFGRWYVQMWDDAGAMTDDQLGTWASSLRGEETAGGFLRLNPRPPLRLAKGAEHAGPEILFSDEREMVIFFVGRCRLDPKDDGKVVALGGKTGPEADWFASRCFKRQDMRMHVQTGERSFARRVINGVEVSNANLAP